MKKNESDRYYKMILDNISNEYHDFIKFLEKHNLINKIMNINNVSFILINEKLMEYKINMLDDDVQYEILNGHIVVDKWCHKSRIKGDYLIYKKEKIGIKFIKTIEYNSKIISMYSCSEILNVEKKSKFCCFF